MNRFPIVGVGASAGGLEAFTQLLENLPSDTGLGFVLVQHLDPKHESALTSLLSRVTTMSVREATDGVSVEPNHVYVIPPNSDIVIVDGVLKLHRRQETGSRRTIDSFFESLAQDQAELAIGVVLSGTASDGTFGLEAIKAEGGLTFAQDQSAKYDSMPRSAITAGCVDFVLPPKDIARELTRIARHPRITLTAGGEKAGKEVKSRATSTRDGVKAGDSYSKIVALLRNHTRVDFSRYKPPTLRRRINRRMILLKIKTLDAYLSRLRGDATEREALYQDILISVTGFFRNPEAFNALAQTVFPKILKGRAMDDPIRIWVAGCSTGQEPYSIAMSLVEAMGDAPNIPLHIYATDLNEALLDRARSALYVDSLVQDVSPERLRRFFVQEKGAYRVSKPIRDMCVFAEHDLIADPPFSRMDFISCRNLLIYVDAEAQKKVIPSFHYALKPTGVLFLGVSETVGSFTELFTPIDKKYRLYSKIPGPSRPLNIAFPAFRQRADKPAAGQPPKHEPRDLDVLREADRVIVRKYAPPGVLINESLEILQSWGATGSYLELPRGKASINVLKMAREGLLLPLRAAINKAKKEDQRVRKENVRINQNGRSRTVNIEVTPLKNLKERCFLVFFESAARHFAREQPASAAESAVKGRGASSPVLPPREEAREVGRLQTELSETRDYLQSLQEQHEATNEELQASGEEVQSSNEELQSIIEELETSKEELESTNEELTTVNEEMAHRNSELTRVTGDLNNLHVSVDMAILLLGRDLRIQRFTPPAEKLFNLLASDIGRPLSAVKSNLDFPDLEQMLSEVIATVSPRKRDVQDKEGHWYSLRARPYLTLDNKVDGAVMTIVDITAIKRALQKIEAIVETVPPLLILDSNLRVNRANQSFCETFQVNQAETADRLIYELGNGQWNISKLRTLLQEILPQKKVLIDFEVEHTFESIGPRAMLVSARELDLGVTGRLILLSIHDITKRKQAELGLRASAERFRAFVTASSDVVYRMSPDWSEMRELNGRGFIADTKTSSRTWVQEYIHPDDQPRVMASINEAIRTKSIFKLEHRVRRVDGSLGWTYSRAIPLLDAKGEIVEWFGTASDVTERKWAEETLRDSATKLEEKVRKRTRELTVSNEELEAFCYSVAHDLRRPLRGIEGFSQVILKSYKDRLDAQGLGYFERIRLAAQHMTILIDSLLDLARLTRTEMRHGEIDLSQQATMIAEELKKKQPERTAAFIIAPGLKMTGDDRLMHIALTNLLENAWKFTSKHPSAKIEFGAIEKDGEQVYFVRDDGAGFDMAYADKLFQTFQRLHTADEFPGTGIGLTIVQRIIQRHGGRIWAEGAVEHGATFHFTLSRPERRSSERTHIDGQPRRRATDKP